MAGRVLRRAAALGFAAATAGSLHAVATLQPPGNVPVFNPLVRYLLLESTRGLQSVLLRARPLNGAHLRDVRALAEHDLKRVDAAGPEGDPAAAADLRLLLALLAARDGRPDEALRRYAEAARDSPSDARPRVLAFFLCVMSDRREEARRWGAAYRRLLPDPESEIILDPNLFPGLEPQDLRRLVNELVIAASLGNVFKLSPPHVRLLVMLMANHELEESLLAALQDRTLSTWERMQLQALRVYLNAKVRFLEWEEAEMIEHNDDVEAPTTS